MIVYDYTVWAGDAVERLFPPTTTADAARIAAALNLLNAIVKLEEGRQFTSYNYIKGMVACLFVWLLYHPLDGVELDWDKQQDITYVRVAGIQYSFHYVPLVGHYIGLCGRKVLTPQQWDGMQRQAIAAELFRQAMGMPLRPVPDEEAKRLLAMMHRYRVRKIVQRINSLEGVPPIVREMPAPPADKQDTAAKKKKHQRQTNMMREFRSFVVRHLPNPGRPRNRYGEWKQQAQKWKDTRRSYLYNLSLCLQFNGWWEQEFCLSRKDDSYLCNVAAYTGSNYGRMVNSIIGYRPVTYIRPERMMKKGWHYYIRRDNWAWSHMTYTRYLLLMGHYNWVLIDGRFYNLCITYGLARYLAAAYPQLRFINVLNFTRFTVHRRVYTANDLQHIGLHSQARQLKVWMVVDPLLLLAGLQVSKLPPKLLEEYRRARNYADFFQTEWHHDRVGLVAYSRFHLLPAIYRDIDIRGHFAHVMNDDGKWAVYSLMEERFDTDFIFDSIYYDPNLYMVVGRIGADHVVIHDMFHPF